MSFLFRNKALENRSVQLKTTTANAINYTGPEGAVVVEKEGTQVNVCVSPNPEIEAKGPRESSSIALEGRFAVEINGMILPYSFTHDSLKDYFDEANTMNTGVQFVGKVREVIKLTAPFAHSSKSFTEPVFGTGLIETPDGYKTVLMRKEVSATGVTFVKEEGVEFDGMHYEHLHAAKDTIVFYNTDGPGAIGIATKKADGSWVKYTGPVIERDVIHASAADSGWIAIGLTAGIETFSRTVDGVTGEVTYNSRMVNPLNGVGSVPKALYWVSDNDYIVVLSEGHDQVTDQIYSLSQGSGKLDSIWTGAPKIPVANAVPTGFVWVSNSVAIIGYGNNVHRTRFNLSSPKNSNSEVIESPMGLANPIILGERTDSTGIILCIDPSLGTNGSWYTLKYDYQGSILLEDTLPPVEFPFPVVKDKVHFLTATDVRNRFLCETVVGDPADGVTEVKLYEYTGPNAIVVVE